MADLGVGGIWQAVKEKRAVRLEPGIDPVEHQDVKVRVEVEGAAEPLDERHGATLGIDQAAGPGVAAQMGEDRTEEDTPHLAKHGAVVGHPVAEREGHGEDPLAHRRMGQDPVDEVGGRVGHAAAAARRAEPAALAGEGDQRVLAAAGAVDPGEAVGEDPAGEEGEQLPQDEGGPVHGGDRGLDAGDEGLEVALEDPVESRVLGSPTSVTRAGRMEPGNRLGLGHANSPFRARGRTGTRTVSGKSAIEAMAVSAGRARALKTRSPPRATGQGGAAACPSHPARRSDWFVRRVRPHACR